MRRWWTACWPRRATASAGGGTGSTWPATPTLKGARCHSHKFDPIPQRDYYRLVDVFKGAFDEHDWMKSNWHPGLSKGRRTDRELPYVPSAERRRWADHNAALQKEIDALRAA